MLCVRSLSLSDIVFVFVTNSILEGLCCFSNCRCTLENARPHCRCSDNSLRRSLIWDVRNSVMLKFVHAYILEEFRNTFTGHALHSNHFRIFCLSPLGKPAPETLSLPRCSLETDHTRLGSSFFSSLFL